MNQSSQLSEDTRWMFFFAGTVFGIGLAAILVEAFVVLAS